MQKLVMAAKTWADPLLSRDLTGLAQYHSGDYRAAEVLFANCRREAPRVAGFAQAHGMAMLERGRELESIEAFMAALKLQPESQEAVTNLRAALERVPGAQIKRAEYTLAVEALEGYPAAPIGRDSRRRTSLPTFSLLMPGGPWTVRDESLPIPTYDRLTFKQAAGVAIGEGTLLIDMDALEGAQEIFVKVGDQLVPAELPRAMRRRTGDAPVAAVEVPNVQFKPVGVLEDDEKFEAETDVVIHAMNVFESMDSEIRKVPAKISKVDEDNAITLSAALAPGESGAPVITSDGKLAGFVAGRTDAEAELGGPHEVIQLEEMSSLLRRSRRSSTRFGRRNALRSEVEPIVAEGQVFQVFITGGERIEQE
jgi:tetratricopeptide (TPR) repeat protein